MALILITHDMGVVAETAERVVGAVCRPEGRGAAGASACSPTRTIPIPRPCSRRCPSAPSGRRLPSIPGVVPGLFDRPTGCLFSPRCRFATDAASAVDRRRPRHGRGQRAAATIRCAAACRTAIPAMRGGRMTRRHVVSSPRTSPGTTPVARGLFRQPAMLKALDGVSFTLRRRRDAGGRRRVRLRQIDARPPGHDDRAADRRAA